MLIFAIACFLVFSKSPKPNPENTVDCASGGQEYAFQQLFCSAFRTITVSYLELVVRVY